MTIYLKESDAALYFLMKYIDSTNRLLNERYNPFSKTIKNRKEYLRNWIETYGSIMQDVETGHYYMVAKIPNIEEIFGTTYCICRIIDDEEQKPVGQMLIKPIESFGNLF